MRTVCIVLVVITSAGTIHFSLCPTVCTLPQWNIALIVIGASAMLFSLVTAVFITVTLGVSYFSKSKLCQVVLVQTKLGMLF